MELRNGKVISNDLESQTKPRYFKLLHKDLTHHGFKYKPSSLNIDPNPFNPSGQCSSGGLYFFSEEQLTNCGKFVDFKYVHYIAEVFLPEDAQVYHEKGKSKADKIYLGGLKEFWSDYDLCWIALSQDGYALECVKYKKLTQEQYFELCLGAISKYSPSLKCVKEEKLTQKQYFDVCLKATTINCYSLRFIKEKKLTQEHYFEVCLEAISEFGCGYALEYVKEEKLSQKQYYDLCLKATTQRRTALKENKLRTSQYYDLCLKAIKTVIL